MLETGPGIKIENEDYNTKMQIFDSTWANSGVYTLKAENESGVDEATVEITVLGMYIGEYFSNYFAVSSIASS